MVLRVFVVLWALTFIHPLLFPAVSSIILSVRVKIKSGWNGNVCMVRSFSLYHCCLNWKYAPISAKFGSGRCMATAPRVQALMTCSFVGLAPRARMIDWKFFVSCSASLLSSLDLTMIRAWTQLRWSTDASNAFAFWKLNRKTKIEPVERRIYLPCGWRIILFGRTWTERL